MEIKHRTQFGELLRHYDMLGHAAEVGVAEGRFSEEIMSWGVTRLYLIDLWAHVPGHTAELGGWDDAKHNAMMQECIDRLKGQEDRYTILRGWTHEMASRIPDESLGFAYIDATHYYDFVMQDMDAYWPKLRKGGIMAGHDYLNPTLTVKPAADEFAEMVGAEIHTVPEDHPDDASFWFIKP
jgi:hypothetical protein